MPCLQGARHLFLNDTCIIHMYRLGDGFRHVNFHPYLRKNIFLVGQYFSDGLKHKHLRVGSCPNHCLAGTFINLHYPFHYPLNYWSVWAGPSLHIFRDLYCTLMEDADMIWKSKCATGAL